MSTLCDLLFFGRFVGALAADILPSSLGLFVSPYSPLLWALASPLGVWASGMGLKGAKHPLRRRQPKTTPAARCEDSLCLSPLWPLQDVKPLKQGNEVTASFKPSREAPGSEEGVSPFLPSGYPSGMYRTTLNDYSQWLLSMTSSCQGCLRFCSPLCIPFLHFSPRVWDNI